MRLTRSATVPVTSTSSAAGRNSARPIQPRSASRPVMSKACLPTAAACRATPVNSTKLAHSRRRTGGKRQHLPGPVDVGRRRFAHRVVDHNARRSAAAQTVLAIDRCRGGVVHLRMSTLADDTRWMDATDQAALVRSGQVSASELLEAAIERIEALDPAINAVVIRWFDHARAVAAGDLPDGPFRGVPFLLKDLWATYAGQPISNGCRALAEVLQPSDADTTLVAGSARPASSRLDARTAPSSAACRPPSRSPGVRRTTRGTWRARRAGRAAARRRRWPRAWCRSPTRATAAGRSASRRRAAGSSA